MSVYIFRYRALQCHLGNDNILSLQNLMVGTWHTYHVADTVVSIELFYMDKSYATGKFRASFILKIKKKHNNTVSSLVRPHLPCPVSLFFMYFMIILRTSFRHLTHLAAWYLNRFKHFLFLLSLHLSCLLVTKMIAKGSQVPCCHGNQGVLFVGQRRNSTNLPYIGYTCLWLIIAKPWDWLLLYY